jgi:hypothetical protein
MAAASNKMTATERKEIRRLVEERFDLLDQQVQTQERHIANIIEENIEEAAKSRLDEAQAKTEALAQRLHAAFDALEEALVPLRAEWQDLVASYEDIEPDVNRYFTIDDESDFDNIEWSVKNVRQQVRKQLDKLKAEKGDATLALSTAKNEMLTDLTLGAVVSDEGRAFLDRIPKVETLTISDAEVVQVLEAPKEG